MVDIQALPETHPGHFHIGYAVAVEKPAAAAERRIGAKAGLIIYLGFLLGFFNNMC
jgi:hypothetical protein